MPEAARLNGLCTGLLPGILVVSMLNFFSARVDLHVVGLVVGGWATVAVAGRRRFLAFPAAVPFAVALLLATILALSGRGFSTGLLVGFVHIAVSGRLVAVRHREFGSQLLVLGGLGAVSLALCDRMLHVEPQWQPAIFLGFAGAALLAGRFRAAGVTKAAAWTVAVPVIGSAAMVGIALAAWVARQEPPLDELEVNLSPVCLRITAGLFVLAAVAVAIRTTGLLRRLVIPGAALLAVFAVAPVNLLLAGDASTFLRPDIEVAIIAIALAFVSGFQGVKYKRAADAVPYLVYALALLAISLTVLQFRNPSTPITVFLAALAPLALFLRGRQSPDLSAHVVGMLLAAWALTLYVVPRTGAPPAEILLLLAAVTALFVIALTGAAGLLRGRSEPWLARAGAELTVVSYLAGVVSAAMVAGNAVELEGSPASTFLAGCGVFSCLTVLAVALYQALARGRVLAAHCTVWSVLTLYLLLATRTRLLVFVDPYHYQAVALIGITVMLGGRRWPRVKTAFRQEGLLLSIPAILLGILCLLLSRYGYKPILRSGTSAFFLAAAAWGLSALRTGSRWQGAISAALINFAVFAFWRGQGIVDLAFYGIPPGLTLLLGSEVLRDRIREEGRKLLFFAGATLLYGSVGVQVLRVEDPTHALVLFGLGLATVIIGFWLKRNDVLMTGTAVVVLDVVAYFLKHGLSETFLGAALLVAAGLIVLTVATRSARRRRQDPGDDGPGGS